MKTKTELKDCVNISLVSLRLVKEKTKKYSTIDACLNSSKKAKDIINAFTDLGNSDVEKFGVLTLDTQNNVSSVHIVHIGTIDYSMVSTREIIKHALMANSINIILFHNHPAGSLKPSSQDLETTNQIKKACVIMGITLLDHVIITSDSYYSFAENQNLN